MEGLSPIDVVGGGTFSSSVALPKRGLLDLGVLDLERAAEMEGQVIAADGRPCPGVEVMLAELQVSGQLRDFVTVAWSSTDRNGRYRFVDLPPGRYRVSARSGDDIARTAADERDIPGGSAEVVDLQFDK